MMGVDGLWKFGKRLVTLVETSSFDTGSFTAELKVVTGRGPLPMHEPYLSSVMPRKSYYVVLSVVHWIDRGLWGCRGVRRMMHTGFENIRLGEPMTDSVRKKLMDEIADIGKTPILPENGIEITYGLEDK